MKKILIISAAVFAVIIAGLIGLLWIGYTGLSTREPTEAEKSMLITVEALADFGYTNLPRAQCETYEAKLNIDGTTELDYEYDSSKAPDQSVLYLTSGISLEKSLSDAATAFDLLVFGMKKGVEVLSDSQLEARPDLCSVGDEQYCAIILSDGNPVGNLVVVRSGVLIHHMGISGIYFDNREYIDEIIQNAIERSNPAQIGKRSR
ncbi:MAG: hypothetical protein JXR25_02180 [Pontiellaceae bacterium]|nr:hypothetical protein [Pontiellaceae bacterium]MBN2783608.1 hypothetical protein [Pontiellaceae bacterium]